MSIDRIAKTTAAGTEATITRLRTELADACAARDALARERDEGRRMIGEQREEALELNRIQHNLQHVLDQYTIGARILRDELAQARDELKDLQGANREFGRQLADMTSNREFWYSAALKAEAERDEARKKAQEQSDEVQVFWLSPAEAEGLRQQLKHIESERDYWLKAHDESECERDKWRQDWEGVTAELLNQEKRLATLDAAEAALERCGISGIYDKFNGVADAIRQMVDRLVQLEGGQALQHERQLRREAEQRAERAEALAAVMNEETAVLLERLAWLAAASHSSYEADKANALAASIREALALERQGDD